MEKKREKAKWLSEKALKIAVKEETKAPHTEEQLHLCHQLLSPRPAAAEACAREPELGNEESHRNENRKCQTNSSPQ
ncbi:unnamed protein product [Rangifer tarandus platyrhynchus]|uniref:Uncharacterized protein n=1 Tax=Rangifer tarandus platyrhynchus TaxID=3082113 RepID=A0AC59Z2N7_RANTA